MKPRVLFIYFYFFEIGFLQSKSGHVLILTCSFTFWFLQSDHWTKNSAIKLAIWLWKFHRLAKLSSFIKISGWEWDCPVASFEWLVTVKDRCFEVQINGNEIVFLQSGVLYYWVLLSKQQNIFGITEFSKQQIFHSDSFNLAVFCITEFCCQSNAADFICIIQFSKQQADF